MDGMDRGCRLRQQQHFSLTVLQDSLNYWISRTLMSLPKLGLQTTHSMKYLA